jgi:protein gp37
MSAKTGIEWTDRTWNPLTGCTKVSPGCDHCYAKTMHERFNGPGSFDTVTLHPERLTQPLGWRKPARVFVNSMSDLFHKDAPDAYIESVFRTMSVGDQHTFQVLTKRPARMRALLSDPGFRDRVNAAVKWPLRNVWLGVSVEDQKWADVRIPVLLDTPAAVRFLSCEPLLGPIDLRQATSTASESQRLDGGQIGWVIVGGESGRGARPMRADWALSLRDQCTAFDIPFLFKQWGEWVPTKTLSVGHLSDPREFHGELVDDGLHADINWRRLYRCVGKKAAGRELDGRTWDQYPDRPTAVLGRPT